MGDESVVRRIAHICPECGYVGEVRVGVDHRTFYCLRHEHDAAFGRTERPQLVQTLVLLLRDSPDVVVVSRADAEEFDRAMSHTPPGVTLSISPAHKRLRAALATEEPTKEGRATPPADEGGTDG